MTDEIITFMQMCACGNLINDSYSQSFIALIVTSVVDVKMYFTLIMRPYHISYV